MVGKTVSHYRILNKLGEGGMGEVYLAEDAKLKRKIALKFLPQNSTFEKKAGERFEREAQAAAKLNHPNIITIYEIGEFVNQTFIAMEYVAGKTMTLKIEEFRLKIEEIIDLTVQICDGLAKAHQAGIVHRDIKPANIMIDPDGRVKILDFGLAKLKGAGKLTKETSTLGTVKYMSPEQARGIEVDHRTDIWSLGVVLYEMLSGQLPFRGEYEQAVIYSIINENPEPVSKSKADIPVELENIINKAMQKKAGMRYQHIGEIKDDLLSIRNKLKINREEKKLVKQNKNDPIQSESSLFQFKQYKTFTLIILVIVLSAFVLYLLELDIIVSAEKNSIAVLPFSNLSGKIENEYFSDGITEDVITQLSKIAELKVISRTSVMQYKNTEKNLRDIGNELNVANILAGSVRREENKVRITAQLIDAKNDEHLWAETYDEALTQIFAIQSKVAKQIAKSLKAKISPSEKVRIERKATKNLEAYDFYLKGRYFLNKRLPDDLNKGIDYFEQALAIDSNYALAYSGLADSYIILGNYYLTPPYASFQKAKAAAKKALEINEYLAEAHTSYAYAIVYTDWDWINAEKEFNRAIELNPNLAQTYGWYGFYLTLIGRFDEAAVMRKKALDLDPFSVIINADIGLELYFERKYDQAIIQNLKTLEINPVTGVLSYIQLGSSYLEKSMYQEAFKSFSTMSMMIAKEVPEGHPIPIAALGYAYAVSGRIDDANNMLELLLEKSAEEYVPSYWIAVVYTGLGDNNNAFKWLDKAYEEKDGSMVFLKVIPIFDILRSDERYNQLLSKMGL